MNSDFKAVLITAKQLAARTAAIGEAINAKYHGKDLVVVGLLKGAYVFTADIVRHIQNPRLNVEFIVASSYKNGQSTNDVKIVLDLKKPIKDKHVVIIEDIVDTGRTLHSVKAMLKLRGAKSVEIAAMCSKPARRKQPVKLDYPAFEIPDEIVVGYGLDYNEFYRQLPDVVALSEKFIVDNRQ